jgi:uncharacterized membrane protein YdjX (TVP38/TMEM64 family)
LPVLKRCSASVSESDRMKTEKKQTFLRVLLLFLIVGLTIILFIYRNQIQNLKHLGYGGIFVLSILANATLILPVPGVVLTTAMGAIFNPFWVAIAAGLGAAIGEITGYLAGYSGQIIVDQTEWYDRLTRWMKRYGNITILVMATIPNPFFDLAGMAAGMLKLPLPRFLFWCSVGKIIKMLAFAYSGATLFKYLSLQ